MKADERAGQKKEEDEEEEDVCTATLSAHGFLLSTRRSVLSSCVEERRVTDMREGAPLHNGLI